MAIWGPTVTFVTVVNLIFYINESWSGWSSLHFKAQHYFFSNYKTLPPCELIYKIFKTPVISIRASLVWSQLIPIIIGNGFQNNLGYSVIWGRVNLLKAPLYLPIINIC